jgi:hypothetical protein
MTSAGTRMLYCCGCQKDVPARLTDGREVYPHRLDLFGLRHREGARGMTRALYPACRRHHAYAMTVDFGMKFKTRNGFWTPEGLLGITGAGGYRIEVAEESMPLLDPHEGDQGIDTYGLQCYFTNGVWMVPHPVSSTADEWATLPVVIDKRDGKAFQWPEFEP